MKFNSRYMVLAAALAGVGLGTIAIAQDATSDSSATTTSAPATVSGRHWHRARGSMVLGTLLRATRQLNLTADQKQAIKTRLSQAHSQYKTLGAMPDVTVLGNPGSASYASAVQNLQTQASGRIQAESRLAADIYTNVLTEAQRQQLPAVLANMQAKMQQRRAAWLQEHAPASSAPGS
ncbi:MAG TPA: hypothetical protein VLX90_19620 [Steroidobacteraceae bacterium]|nr:hypothetical protein [Steroidobacteraceae bacterium]